MKIITIGRDEDANIIIDDPLISRRHATIRLLPLGKMEIKDLSKNGTFVNGVRIAPDKFVPVKRKDVVSFAKVAQLDWNEVPDNMRTVRITTFIVIGLLAILAVIAVVTRIDWTGKKAVQEIELPYEGPAPATADQSDTGEKTEESTVESKAKDATIPEGADLAPKPKKQQKDKDSKEKAKEEEVVDNENTQKEKQDQPQEPEKDKQTWF